MELCIYCVLTGNSPHKKDTVFIVCFYLTSVCPTDVCMGWLLPLCSSVQLWSSSAKHEGGIIRAFFAESVGGDRLIVEVERLFSWLLLKRGTCFWVLCWYTGSPVVSLGLNLTWTGITSHILHSVQSHAFKTSCHISNKTRKKLCEFCFLHLSIVISPLRSLVVFPIRN